MTLPAVTPESRSQPLRRPRLGWAAALSAALATALALFTWGFLAAPGDAVLASKLLPAEPAPPEAGAGPQLATFGGGCFWCTEAVFQRLRGVLKVESGYSGGARPNPTYYEICTGLTGHAEVIQITYDPQQVSFAQLLEVFWQTHDPTTLNRQGHDEGTQYRSVIFYHTPQQRESAERYKQQLGAAGVFSQPIVTEISPFTAFYKAEEDHQNYYNQNAAQRYCRYVIEPKLDKLRKVFADRLRDAP